MPIRMPLITPKNERASFVVQRAARARSVPLVVPAVVERALATPGRALDTAARERLETRFGHHLARIAVQPRAANDGVTIVAAEDASEREADEVAKFGRMKSPLRRFSLGEVRIHTDASAVASARALHALAFTVGRDIFFDTGQYAPGTQAGEQLLAHEVAHVVQQTRARQAVPVIQRKQASKGLPPADALQVALNGDDDAVRDLTNNTAWAEVKLDPKQSATLMEHLLVGFTGDDDEEAGLKVLNKDIDQGILDPTLLELNRRGRLGQLLDDYHGEEYRQLLKLLSNNILDIKVKFFYLDLFINMTWVREHEERAIVRLLDKTSLSDRARLLETEFREEELRKAIDTDEVSVRYEELVKEALGERAKKIYKEQKEWRKIFDEQVERCKPKGMSGARAKELWKAALVDLEKELAKGLIEYTDAVLHEVIRPFGEPDPSKLAEINRAYRKQTDQLLERKRAEFCSELKWNLEFNRDLNEAFGTVWTVEDLRKMDEILAKIPPEILHANPDFKIFEREAKRASEPWLWGESDSSGGVITILHEVNFKTTAHELGHMVHDAQPSLLTEFTKISQWELLDTAKIDALKKGDKKNDPDFDKLLARLEEKRKKDGSSRAECGEEYKDGFFYLYNRYGGGYYRHPAKLPEGSDFITDYAGTHPKDDFAESFAYYFVNPDKLQRKAYAKKFKFMHIEVFVKFWLEKQRRDVSAQFAKIHKDAMPRPMYGTDLYDDIIQQYVDPLYDELTEAWTQQAEAKVKEVEADKKSQLMPLKGSTEVQKVAEPYLAQLRDLSALGGQILKVYSGFLGELEAVGLFLDPALQDAYNDLHAKLADELKTKLWAEFEPLADRIRKGERITRPKWQEVETLKAQYAQAANVFEPYLPVYAQVLKARPEFSYFVMDILRKYTAKSPQWEKIRLFAVERIKALMQMQTDMVTAVRKGKPFDPAVFKDPKPLLEQYKKEVADFAKTVK